MQRRSILAGLAGIMAAGFAPAAVGSNVLMPVRKIIATLPDEYILRINDKYGHLAIGFLRNGNTVINGKMAVTEDGRAFVYSFCRNYEGEIIHV